MKHRMKPLAYMRYGDDWLCFTNDISTVMDIRKEVTAFFQNTLSLTVNPKIDEIQRAYKGVSYLGVDIWPSGRRLQKTVKIRLQSKLLRSNAASYRSLILAHENKKSLKEFDWRLLLAVLD